MLTQILTSLIAPVAGVVQSIQTNKARKNELEQARHLKVLEGINNAESAQFQGDIERSKGLTESWKDEFITIIVTIPMFMCFIPGMDVYVTSGFEALNKTPDWFQYLIIGVYSVGAGVPLAGTTVKTVKSILSPIDKVK